MSARSRMALVAAGVVLVVGGATAGVALGPGGAVVAGAAARGTHAAQPHCGAGAPKVTVTGTGDVSITPDLLTLRLDVRASSAQASTALSQDNSVTAAVEKALSAGGVTARDLQTTDLTIQPEYANTGTAVTGYAVDDVVVAKVRKLAAAGTLIDKAVAAGGNDTSIDSLSLSLTRPLRAQGRARDLAVHQAMVHAKAIAAAAREHVTGICSIRDDTATSATSPVPYANFGATAASAARVPVRSGSETVHARVTIVFGLA